MISKDRVSPATGWCPRKYRTVLRQLCSIQTFSVRLRIQVARRFARLYGNATLAGLSASQLGRLQSVLRTSSRTQRHSQTDSLIFSVSARHTAAERPSMAAVSRVHRFQAGRARFADAVTWRHGSVRLHI